MKVGTSVTNLNLLGENHDKSHFETADSAHNKMYIGKDHIQHQHVLLAGQNNICPLKTRERTTIVTEIGNRGRERGCVGRNIQRCLFSVTT